MNEKHSVQSLPRSKCPVSIHFYHYNNAFKKQWSLQKRNQNYIRYLYLLSNRRDLAQRGQAKRELGCQPPPPMIFWFSYLQVMWTFAGEDNSKSHRIYGILASQLHRRHIFYYILVSASANTLGDRARQTQVGSQAPLFASCVTCAKDFISQRSHM